MKMKIHYPNKAISIILCIITLLSLCSCSGGIKKDVLYKYDTDDVNSPQSYVRAVVEDYTEIFAGSLIAYNPWSGVSIYSNTANVEGVASGNGLYAFSNDGQKSLTTSANRFTEASVTQSGYVYFKERDDAASEYVYVTDTTAEKKTLIAKSPAERSLVWCVSELGTFAYVDDKNMIKSVKDGMETIVYELSSNITVKKMRYCESDGIFIIVANNGGSSDVLYRLDAKDNAISAVDVNVTDISVVTSADRTAYVKIDSRGQKQLYVYDHNTLSRVFVMSGNIDRFALSPFGGHIAYVTKSTEASPTQSVWIVNCRDFSNVQVTANTNVSGSIYWTSDEKGLLFTASETTDQLMTSYKTYSIKFKYEYAEE
ncbi:MAG: hypothetical protein E7218_01135 [Anaerofustis stercorihominis]|nr:hypothetical protein [Anaerofustis stercorihominis]